MVCHLAGAIEAVRHKDALAKDDGKGVAGEKDAESWLLAQNWVEVAAFKEFYLCALEPNSIIDQAS